MPASKFAFDVASRTRGRNHATTLLLAVLLLLPAGLAAKHDKDHNDDHHWDNHEDRAYRMYVKENHRKYRRFDRVPENDQQAYWGWRHEHSDAVLKINIH